MNKLGSQELSELERYFHPKSLIVSSLPDVKTVKDSQEVYIKKSNGKYDSYKMVSGRWIKTGIDLTE
jgi:hypothetical protein